MNFLYGALIFGVLCVGGYLATKSRRAKRTKRASAADHDAPPTQPR